MPAPSSERPGRRPDPARENLRRQRLLRLAPTPAPDARRTGRPREVPQRDRPGVNERSAKVRPLTAALAAQGRAERAASAQELKAARRVRVVRLRPDPGAP